jgi:hypothetical protein
MNVIDSGDHDFARAQLATLFELFDHVTMIAPPGGVDTRASSNWVLLASPVLVTAVPAAAQTGGAAEGALDDRIAPPRTTRRAIDGT